MPKKEATKFLQESYGLSVSDPDENLRFILGKCNPVLLIPGIYSTKLKVELQCKNIATEEKYTTLLALLSINGFLAVLIICIPSKLETIL